VSDRNTPDRNRGLPDRQSKKTRGRQASRRACRDVLTLAMLDALESEAVPDLARFLRLGLRDGRLRQCFRRALDEADAEDPRCPPPGICVIWAQGFDASGPLSPCYAGPTVATFAEALAARAELEAAHAGEPGRVCLSDLHGDELDVSKAWGQAAGAAEGGA
jgi:hypothetical protein